MTTLPLTLRQAQVLKTICRLATRHGEWPISRDLADALGIAAVNGVHGHLESLRRKGWLTRAGSGRSRGIRLAGARLALAFDDSPAGGRLFEALDGGLPTTGPGVPTECQARVLRELCRHASEHGGWPSFRELSSALAYRTTNAVACHLQGLERKGYILPPGRGSRKSRSIRPAGARLVLTFDDSPEGQRLRGLVEGQPAPA